MREEIRAKSFTYAMKGKKLLEKRGVTAEVVKKAEDCGCIYVIRFTPKFPLNETMAYLESNGVKLIK